jgi:hypothetical protein
VVLPCQSSERKRLRSGEHKTTDEHQAFAFANDLFNKTPVRVAGGQEINAKKAQAATRMCFVIGRCS